MDTDVLAREFAAQVRDVLAHLLDPVHLQSHPLAASLVAGDVHDPGVRAQLLREAVLQAIADLKPAGSVPSTDPAARPHTILSRKYIQGFSNERFRGALIGRRQFFRRAGGFEAPPICSGSAASAPRIMASTPCRGTDDSAGT